MPVNDFLAFAADPAANVIDQPTYAGASFTQRITGFQTGTAFSDQCNKVWRQATMMAAMLGQFIVNEAATDAIDDGSPAGQTALLANFTTAVRQAGSAGFGGYLPLSGGTLTGPLGISSGGTQFAINAPAGSGAVMALSRNAGLVARLFANTASALRWTFDLADATPETGANAGSNLVLSRFADGGAFLDSPLTINRATGVVNFAHSPTINGGNLPYLPITGGTLTGPMGVASPGITYAGTSGHYMAWGWNGNINAYVDGSYQGDVALTSWVASTVGRYLPLTGGTLSGPGNLAVNGNLNVAGNTQLAACYFANIGDFYITTIGGGWRILNWAASWWDGWNGNSGQRMWMTYSGATMQLDYNANLSLSGNISSNGGRIVSIIPPNGNASVAVWSQAYGAGGMWFAGDGLWWGWTDGNGNPNSNGGQLRLGQDGTLTNWQGITCYNWIQCSAWFSAGGAIYSNDRVMARSGYPMLASWNTSAGVAAGRYVDGGGLHWSGVDGSGNPTTGALMTLTMGGVLYTAGGVGTPSDRKLKSKVEPSKEFDSLAAIRALSSMQYDFDPTGRHQPFGLLAQDVEPLLPDVVHEHEGTSYIDSHALLIHTIRAVQQLAARLS